MGFQLRVLNRGLEFRVWALGVRIDMGTDEGLQGL